MAARDPRHTASNLLLGFAGGATVLAAAVSTTTGHQGPFAAAGLGLFAAGAGVASRALAVDVVEGERADLEMVLADAYTDLEYARIDAEAAHERAAGLALDMEMGWTG